MSAEKAKRRQLMTHCLLAASLLLCSLSSAMATPWPVSTLFEQASGGGAPAPQFFENTTSLRALELSPDASALYSGWLHGPREVWRHDPVSGAVTATYDMGGVQANAIATDDRGFVYIGEGDYGAGAIKVAPSGLDSTVKTFGTKTGTEVEGLSIRKVLPPGADLPNYYLYVTRNDGTVERYDVTDPANPTPDASFGTGGVYDVLAGKPLRGIEVAGDGTMFVAQRDSDPGTGDRSGFVYAIPPTLPTDPAAIPSYGDIAAMDLALYGDTLYVTTYDGEESMVFLFDVSGGLAFSDMLEPMVVDGLAREDFYGYGGIDIAADGRVFFADQWYSISGENLDRILTNPPMQRQLEPIIPEPGTFGLVGLGLLGFARRRRRC